MIAGHCGGMTIWWAIAKQLGLKIALKNRKFHTSNNCWCYNTRNFHLIFISNVPLSFLSSCSAVSKYTVSHVNPIGGFQREFFGQSSICQSAFPHFHFFSRVRYISIPYCFFTLSNSVFFLHVVSKNIFFPSVFFRKTSIIILLTHMETDVNKGANIKS